MNDNNALLTTSWDWTNTISEVRTAIRPLKNNKCVGLDSIHSNHSYHIVMWKSKTLPKRHYRMLPMFFRPNKSATKKTHWKKLLLDARHLFIDFNQAYTVNNTRISCTTISCRICPSSLSCNIYTSNGARLFIHDIVAIRSSITRNASTASPTLT